MLLSSASSIAIPLAIVSKKHRRGYGRQSPLVPFLEHFSSACPVSLRRSVYSGSLRGRLHRCAMETCSARIDPHTVFALAPCVNRLKNALMSALQIAMAAGETSGDLLAGAVIRQLSMRLPPDSRYFGIGGAQMRAAGFQARFPSEKLAVRGYVEAARPLPEILWLRRAFKRTLRPAPPSVFVGVDAPDFNLGLECALRRAGIPTVHFISPSIWAWRGARIHKIKRATDLMLCVFPFETEIYARAGIVHRYVGHPLADLIPFKPDPMAARRTLGLPESRPAIVAVLPGSRNSEIA